jgi:hypothetical protein
MTEPVSVSPSGFIQSTYICGTMTCTHNFPGFPGALFTSGSATLVNVPEPTSLALLGTGIAGLAVLRRRKTNA